MYKNNCSRSILNLAGNKLVVCFRKIQIAQGIYEYHYLNEFFDKTIIIKTEKEKSETI